MEKGRRKQLSIQPVRQWSYYHLKMEWDLADLVLGGEGAGTEVGLWRRGLPREKLRGARVRERFPGGGTE